MTEGNANLDVLQQLEDGRIDLEEAVRRLEQAPATRSTPTRGERHPQAWWLIPLAIGMALLGAGGWSASAGGAWWILAVPLLLIGSLLTVLAAARSQSPWVYLRVRQAGRGRARVWIPIPIRAAVWALQIARPWVPALNATGVDEVLQSLEQELGAEGDLVIEVDESGDDERVRVSFEQGRPTWHRPKND